MAARRKATYLLRVDTIARIDDAWRTWTMLDGSPANGKSDYVDDLLQRHKKSPEPMQMASPDGVKQRCSFAISDQSHDYLDRLVAHGKIPSRGAFIDTLVAQRRRRPRTT